MYVAVASSPGTFEGRTVVLGPRTSDYYVVREGLTEGDMVVVNGNFKIDSALQILAGRSMMSAEELATGKSDPAPSGPAHPATSVPTAFRSDLTTVLQTYLAVHAALSRDDFGKTREAAGSMWSAVGAVRAVLLETAVGAAWVAERNALLESMRRLAKAADLSAARTAFDPMSMSLERIIKRFGTSREIPIHRFHCPMAFDNRGAYWLQSGGEVENPYFGSAMFRCGKMVEAISQPEHAQAGHSDEHGQ